MGLFITLVVLAVLYVVPGIVATNNGHGHREAIWALNILLGWTFVGWVVALVWALIPVKRDETVQHGLVPPPSYYDERRRLKEVASTDIPWKSTASRQ
jgi:hypothetical protein